MYFDAISKESGRRWTFGSQHLPSEEHKLHEKLLRFPHILRTVFVFSLSPLYKEENNRKNKANMTDIIRPPSPGSSDEPQTLMTTFWMDKENS